MTQEEIIQAISDDKMMPFIQPEQLAGIVNFVIKNYEPSLPSNLDKAANKYADGENPTCPCEECLIKTFKTGAEWMAGQGETHEAEIIESVPFGGTTWKRCVRVWLDDQFSAKGNKVIVQIRNK